MYTPQTAAEAAYYDQLFMFADTNKNGKISGSEAVTFLMTSGVGQGILKEIWNIADASRSSFLDKQEFYVASRLISLAQNQVLPNVANLAASQTAQLPLPRFQIPQLQQFCQRGHTSVSSRSQL